MTATGGGRQNRKREHLEAVLHLEDGPCRTGFEDIRLVHCALPELDLDDVSLETTLCGLRLGSPLIINAITGGSPDIERVNASLAALARDLGLAMAVGSQTAAIEDPAVRTSFSVVRRVNPGGIVLANVGAHVPPEWALEAVDMVQASALQVHLNVAQELAMSEGERKFRGLIGNIRAIVSSVGVPVIVKEVGFGLAREEAISLARCGVSALDVGGQGGTNFVAIEGLRRGERAGRTLLEWGLPTAVSLAETVTALAECGLERNVQVIAGGGLRDAGDMVKALCLGAQVCSIAAPLARAVLAGQEEDVRGRIGSILRDLKLLMLLVGAAAPGELKEKAVIIMGKTAEWLTRRGINVDAYARAR